MSVTNKIRLGGMLILVLAVVYTIVARYPGQPHALYDVNMINVYFFNPATGRLEAERRVMPEGNYRDISFGLWEMIVAGPESSALSGVFPENMIGNVKEIRNFRPTLEDRGIRWFEVYMNSYYLEVPPISEVIFRSAVVWTFTDLDWITDVRFFVDNVPLSRFDGGAIGLMNRDNVLISPQITMEQVTRRTVELYFANNTLTGLVAEHRTIEIPSNLTLERVVLNELMRGPNTPGLISLIPPGTVINDVYTERVTQTCYVDLNPQFDLRLTPGTPSRKLAVYSIVSSLINLRGDIDIREVQFLINGERAVSRGLDVDLSYAFELNEDIIIPRADMEFM